MIDQFIINTKYWIPYINNGKAQAVRYIGTVNLPVDVPFGQTWHRFEYWDTPKEKMTLPDIPDSIIEMMISEDQRIVEGIE